MLNPGTRLGPYEIASPLGVGGMGEVYRARDTRLQRTVAIKILPSQLASNPDLKQRFEREARAISSLQHPNICVLFDIGSEAPNGNGGEQHEKIDFLVMEYLEGETLAERLKKGALPVEQTVRMGMEVATALDRAHRAGIVHRDLKPGNVMLTKGGAKLMDFGLAKGLATPAASLAAAGAVSGNAPLLSAAVTMTSPSPQISPLTSVGTIVGTIQYMSPEQIEGKEADARSDIFALGAVLYESATGRRAFQGKSQITVASAILEKDPEPISAIQPLAPPLLEQTVQTCLAKDPEERFQTAHDVALQLSWIVKHPASAAAAPREQGGGRRIILAAGAALAIMAAATGGYWLAPKEQGLQAVRAVIEPPEKLGFHSTGDFSGPPVLSPQGDKILFSAHTANGPQVLWVRPIDSFSAQRLEGTEGAYNPFWSPDGRYVAFFSNAKLYRMAVNGGPISTLAEAGNARGGSWGPDDTILFSPDFQAPLLRVFAGGGKPTIVTKLDTTKHSTHRWPKFLPDGKHFLYLATNHNGGQSEANGVYFGSLDGKENRLLVTSDSGADYANGYLLFHSGTALLAQPFDPSTGRLSGSALTVVDKVRHDSGVWRALFTVSQNGLLAYEPGSGDFAGSRLMWFDRTGKELGALGERGAHVDPRISPDGKKVAVTFGDPQGDIWIIDLARGGKSRLTFRQTSGVGQPTWSPDGKFIAYTFGIPGTGGGRTAIFTKAVNGIGAEKLQAGSESATEGYTEGAWSPDGRYFAYVLRRGTTGHAIYAKELSGNSQPFPVVVPSGPQANIEFYRISPNGRWVVYSSDESGRPEIYVAPFPHGEGKWQVSTMGADFPTWRGDSKEVFFLTVSGQVFACPITEKGNELEAGIPQVLFHTNPSALGFQYDVSPDGKRFLINLGEDETAAPLRLVVNWPAELKKK